MVRSRRVVARVIGALSALVMLAWIVSLLGVVAWAHRDGARTADAIVVLGAAQYVGRPSPVLKARLDHAVALWRKGLAPRLVLTGGTGVGDTTSEAAVSRRYALQHGVPDSAIVAEYRGHTTRESLRAIADLLRARRDTTVILVSDPFHMLRLSVLARKMGLVPYTSPTRTSPISDNLGEEVKYVVSESVKVPLAYILERRSEK